MVVYLLKNLITKKVFIGTGIQPKSFDKHRGPSRIRYAILRFPLPAQWETILLFEGTASECEEKQIEFIHQYDSCVKGYNNEEGDKIYRHYSDKNPRTLSTTQKEKISISAYKRPVLDRLTGVVYPSMMEASKSTKAAKSTVYFHCHEQVKRPRFEFAKCISTH